MNDEERRILIAAIATGIAKRIEIGSGFDKEKDRDWLEERAARLQQLIEELT